MRSKDAAELSDAEMREVIEGWHATIGKAILETWGLPETLQHAVEHQDEYESEFEGDASLSDVLLAAKLLARGDTDRKRYPALRRTGVMAADGSKAIDQYAEELQSVRVSLDE
jgi:HD-like signal output (HDOD) protein